jgi:hypothetical protein
VLLHGDDAFRAYFCCDLPAGHLGQHLHRDRAPAGHDAEVAFECRWEQHPSEVRIDAYQRALQWR